MVEDLQTLEEQELASFPPLRSFLVLESMLICILGYNVPLQKDAIRQHFSGLVI